MNIKCTSLEKQLNSYKINLNKWKQQLLVNNILISGRVFQLLKMRIEIKLHLKFKFKKFNELYFGL